VSPRRGAKSSRGRTKAEDQAERLLAAGEQLAATGRKLNRDPRLLAIIQGLRKVLPGDERVATRRRSAPVSRAPSAASSRS
jgi:hypothetical protein